MPRLSIDNQIVEVAEGATILDAARQCGIEIPTLCYLDGHTASTSCLVCAVKVNGSTRFVPACATVATEGMVVESETEEVRANRKITLELLLGDHLGDCIGPCQSACSAHMDIPNMLRAIAEGRWADAVAVVKEAIPLPSILGRVCPNLCENACRRRQQDAPVAICLLKRAAGDHDIAASSPYAPPCAPPSGKRVAIIGAGPAGLTAAYYLQRAGIACTTFDAAESPGGALRTDITKDDLPRAVLDAEIAFITRIGVQLQLGKRVGKDVSLDDLRREFDAVLLACGKAIDAADSPFADLLKTGGGKRSHNTAQPDVFITGSPTKYAVQGVAAGASAARAILRYLQVTSAMHAQEHLFTVRIGQVTYEELSLFMAHASPSPRSTPIQGNAEGYTEEEARREAERCLHCDCRKLESCKLRECSILYDAHPARFKGERREFEQELTHSELIYESGKCIDCGLCIQIASEAKEELGLSFVGRGFTVRVAVPFHDSLAEGLRRVGLACAEACPTGALARKD